MKITFLENKKEWNDFVLQNDGNFLQSFEWGEFQKTLGKKVWRIAILRKGSKVMEAQIILERLFLGRTFLYIPFGPVFSQDIFLKGKKKALEILISELKKIAKKEKAFFLKIEPKTTLPLLDIFLPQTKRIQPQQTLVLKLSMPLEKIFENLHHKTRYNIKLARKKGVEIKELNFQELNESEKEKYFKIFWKLLKKSSQRKKFFLHPKEYYKILLFDFGKPGDKEGIINYFQPLVFFAIYQGKFIATNLILIFGKEMVCLQGGSDYKFRNLMAPHLLQWKQIEKAKSLGLSFYDLWGIDDQNLPGLSRFKRGFVSFKILKNKLGKEIQYPEGKEVIFQKPWYIFYKIARKIL